ncbi:MAG: helix-turn-helix domain-containing protein [Chloroflexi bacterium]|nr:helix-turn-helix domain-containing protein [Chloroflexota bacterium]
MPGPQPASVVHLTSRVRKLLKRLLRRQQLPRCLVWRIRIVLQAAQGRSNSRIAHRLGLDRGTVRLWWNRWAAAHRTLLLVVVAQVNDAHAAQEGRAGHFVAAGDAGAGGVEVHGDALLLEDQTTVVRGAMPTDNLDTESFYMRRGARYMTTVRKR